jgi:hypothetical protein
VLDPAYVDQPLESAADLNKLRSSSRQMSGAEASGLGSDDPDIVFVERTMPVRRGKWTMVPPSVTEDGPA